MANGCDEYKSNANRQDVDYTHAEQANMAALAREQERVEEQAHSDGPFIVMGGEQEMHDWRVMARYRRNFGPEASSSTLRRGDIIEGKE